MLVTGGAGFIGSNLAEALAEAKVHCPDDQHGLGFFIQDVAAQGSAPYPEATVSNRRTISLGSDNWVWVCGSFEVRAIGGGVCVGGNALLSMSVIV